MKRASVSVHPGGLRAVHRTVPGALASVYLWFEAGTVDERDGEHGAAHLLEHMLFKGTATHGVGEVAAAIEGLGGDLNAYTTWDQTVLHATVLADHWEAALDVLADMAWRSALDPDELAREAPVVQEEIRGYDSDPDDVLEDALTARLFADHPYGAPVLGTLESVAGIDRERLHGFWRRHYTANRCILSVAGPMSAEDVQRVADRLGSAAPTGPARDPVAPASPARPRVERLDREFDTSLVALGWRVPGDADGDDLAALEVLATALGSGRASLLQAELRMDQRLVADAWATLHTRVHGGSLEIGLAPIQDDDDRALTRDAVAGALAIVDRVRSGGLAALDVERARQTLLADLMAADETVDAVAHELAWFTSRAGDPDAREAWRREIASVSTDQVTDAARRWLTDPIVLVLDDPDGPLPRLRVRRTSARGVALDPRVHVSGPADGWASQGPFASVYLAFPGGKLVEGPKSAGTSGAWAATAAAGTQDLDSVELAAELDRMGASLHAVGGRNTLGLQLTVVASNLEPAMALLDEVVRAPRFDPSDWEREREEILLDLDTLSDRPDDVLARRTWSLAFPGHPWGLVRTRTAIAAISTRRLRAYHQDRVTGHGVQVGVAGPVDPERVGALLQPTLDGLPEGSPVPPRPPLGEHPTGTHRSRAGHEQALVAWAARTSPIGVPDDVPIRVAVALLSAQAGRLFMALRERRSLAYSVWARTWEGPDAGLLALGLATEPGRARAAQQALLDEVARLRDAGPDPDELERTRRMMLGQHAMGLQRAAGRAAQLALAALYGRDPSIEAERALLDAVTPERVRDAIARLPEGFVVVVRP